MDEFGKLAYQELEVRRAAHRQVFWLHAVVWALTGVLLFVIWLLATPDAMPWFIIPILAWGIFLGGHAAWVFVVRNPQEIIMDKERRVLAAQDAQQQGRQAATSQPSEQQAEPDAAAGVAVDHLLNGPAASSTDREARK